jgi:preprotein translocase subunit SecB
MSEKKQEVSTKMQILGQFIKDLSFENIAAQESKQGTGTPNIEVKINLDASKRTQDDQYNSSIKISVESKDTKTYLKLKIFLMISCIHF